MLRAAPSQIIKAELRKNGSFNILRLQIDERGVRSHISRGISLFHTDSSRARLTDWLA